MISITIEGHVGSDGLLTVQVPTPLRETDVEVTLVLHPVPMQSPPLSATGLTPEELGWPPGFFEETFGVWKGEPLERGPQGEYETRERLA